jgi:hypothetical protein
VIFICLAFFTLISKEKKSNTASEGESISKKIRKDSQSDVAGQQRKEEKVPRATRPGERESKKKCGIYIYIYI